MRCRTFCRIFRTGQDCSVSLRVCFTADPLPSGASSELVQQMRDEMELHMSALQAKQEGESMLKQQIMELSSKVDELQDDLYKQQALGESLQAERDELRQTVEEKSEHEAEVERLRESMAALSQVVVSGLCICRCSSCWYFQVLIACEVSYEVSEVVCSRMNQSC